MDELLKLMNETFPNLHGAVFFFKDADGKPATFTPMVRIQSPKTAVSETVEALRHYGENLIRASDDIVKSTLPKN